MAGRRAVPAEMDDDASGHGPRSPRRLDRIRDGQEAAVAETTVDDVLAELAALEDPMARAVN